VVLGGSVITEEDAAKMLGCEVAAVFGSGSVVSDMIETVRRLVAAGSAS
jgi:hypothetical protein